jgi:hypothetical protein
MDSEVVYYCLSKDKLFSEYHNSSEGKKYLTYSLYLKDRGLSTFKSVILNDRPMNQYTIIDKKKFLFIKIKYEI